MDSFPLSALNFSWNLDPRKKDLDDLIALSYVLAFLASRSPLPWDPEYRILVDALLNETVSEDHADACYNSLAQVKLSQSEMCCEGLPLLYSKFMNETLDLSPESTFDYDQYSSEFDKLHNKLWRSLSP